MGTTRTDQAKSAGDKIIAAFLGDIENETKTWQQIAKEQIPSKDLEQLGEFTFENVGMYAINHASPLAVERLFMVLLYIGTEGDQKA